MDRFKGHIRMHFRKEGVWVLTCGVCKEEFEDEKSLRHHEWKLNHKTTRQLPTCRWCQRTFQRDKDLKKHELNHQTIDLAKFTCTLCYEMFKTEKHYNYHMEAKHGPDGPKEPDPNQYLQGEEKFTMSS
ncbi:uncharacterized protein [Bemisia tabaci]|uniref:uncharacterized protein isoform X2 n=1 Tax=Bemisia tabaci TaxID=7038 RepID=UPI003B287A5E